MLALNCVRVTHVCEREVSTHDDHLSIIHDIAGERPTVEDFKLAFLFEDKPANRFRIKELQDTY